MVTITDSLSECFCAELKYSNHNQITRSQEIYRVSKYMCDHRNPERGPIFQVGNERNMNEWMNYNIIRKELDISESWTGVRQSEH
jgi:hypothetical protein